MGRTIITEEDVAALEPGGRLVVDAETTMTAPARDLARRRGIEVEDAADAAAHGAPATVELGPDGALATGPHAVHAHEATAAHGGKPPRTLIVTSVGVNRPGVLAELSAAVAGLGGDIQDMSQRITGGYFNAILVVDIHHARHDFAAFRNALQQLSVPTDYVVNVIDARVFQAMHRI